MSPKLDEYLKKKFPKIYGEPEKESCFTMFGFECNDGWFRILLWLSEYVQRYIDSENDWAAKYPDQAKPVEQVKALQVKEKFGTLRFYYSGGDDKIQSVVSFVEFMSGKVCERTGSFEDIGRNAKGWIKTQHVSLSHNGKDFNYVEDEELRNLLSEHRFTNEPQ